MSKIDIRLLIKRGIYRINCLLTAKKKKKRDLRVGREHSIKNSGEAPVLSWGFLGPESYSYSILGVSSFSGIFYVA